MSMLVGICGGSGSGKSTLAKRVQARLGVDTAAILSFDTYYKDLQHLSFEERAAANFDHPETLDVDLFVEHLDALVAGQSVELPVYDFSTHTRLIGASQTLAPAPVILVEGILLFAFAEVAERLALRIYRSCPEHIRFARRLDRDTSERGRTAESVEAQFATTVAPMHDHFVLPSMERAHLVYEHGALELDEICDQVAAEIGRRRPAEITIDFAESDAAADLLG